jgi:predicted phage terminase large subunit-like protein
MARYDRQVDRRQSQRQRRRSNVEAWDSRSTAREPEGDKNVRAAAVSPLIEAGNVYLPHPLFAPRVNDFIEECVAFPNGAHDDQVDAMTQALLRLSVASRQPGLYVDPAE